MEKYINPDIAPMKEIIAQEINFLRSLSERVEFLSLLATEINTTWNHSLSKGSSSWCTMHCKLLIVFCFIFVCSTTQADQHGTDCSVVDNVKKNRTEQQKSAWVANRINLNQECYFGEKDSADWVMQVKGLLKTNSAEANEVNIEQQLSALKQAVSITKSQLTSEGQYIPFQDVLLNDLIGWQEQLNSLKPNDYISYLSSVNNYTLSGNGLKFGEHFDFNTPLQSSCSLELWKMDKQPCLIAVESVEKSFRYMNALSAINKFSGRDDMRAVIADLGELDLRWTAYFDNARPQNILELFWNSDRSKKRNGGGFSEVPNNQFIVLHPGIAMEYVGDAEDGTQLKESLIVELLGYNRWSWSAGGQMKNAFGASAIASFSDRLGVDDFAWGAMLHINHKYSFGVTWRENDPGYFISLDLQQFYTNWTQKNKSKFTGFDKLREIIGSE